MDRFVRLGRAETATVEQVCSGMSLAKIPWLKCVVGSIKDTDNATLNAQFRAFIYWVYTDVVNVVLRNCFYITEGEAYGNEVLYYRHNVWQKLSEIGAAQIKENFIQVFPGRNGLVQANSTLHGSTTINDPAIQETGNIGFTTAVHQQQLAFVPSIRMVPKAKSMRPITNLRSVFLRNKSIGTNRKNQLPEDEGSSVATGTVAAPRTVMTNAALYNILHVLRDMASQRPELCGFGVMGSDGIYAKLREYKANLVKQTHNGTTVMDSLCNSYVDVSSTPFYIATLDLDKCYDSMDTVQLYDLVQSLLARNDDGHTAPEGRGTEEEEGGSSLIHKYTVSHYISSLEKKVLCKFSEMYISPVGACNAER